MKLMKGQSLKMGFKNEAEVERQERMTEKNKEMRVLI